MLMALVIFLQFEVHVILFAIRDATAARCDFSANNSSPVA